MSDETPAMYRDDRRRVLGLLAKQDRETQTQHLESVSARIGKAIVAFVKKREGETFHADDLRKYVTDVCGQTAPGSSDRVLRDLRQRGFVSYVVVDRSRSLYRCGP